MAEKSRLAEILSVEEDEKFTIKGEGYLGFFRIHDGVREQSADGKEWKRWLDEVSLTDIINDPSLIQKKPRFSDEEMTFLRLLRKYGKVTGMYKDNRGVAGVGLKSSYGLGTTVADCLLKPGEAIDLDELLKEDNDGEAD